MSDVFISYSRLDKEFVGQLREALLHQKQEIWIDWESIPPSQTWWDEIKKGIARANNFIVVLSPHSMASPICQLEVEYARTLKKRIIPVLHADYDRETSVIEIMQRLSRKEETTTREIWHERHPYDVFDANDGELKHLNYFFFREGDDFQAKFDDLFAIIRTDYEHKELHTTLKLRALEWDRRGRDSSFLLLDTELKEAQDWLAQSAGKLPVPTELHREYIQASEKRTRQLHNLQRTAIVLGGVVVLAVIAGIIAGLTALDAIQRTNLAGTSEAEAISLQETVVFEATVFRVQMARSSTQIAGLGALPERTATLEPHAILAEATLVATRVQWQPVMQRFDGVEMMLVPAGCFWMGDQFDSDTRPIHEICFSDNFWIDRYEVTNRLFDTFDGEAEAPSRWLDADFPRTDITFEEAVTFCGQRGGRLPTEPEWEYAARGPNSLRNPWGNELELVLSPYGCKA